MADGLTNADMVDSDHRLMMRIGAEIIPQLLPRGAIKSYATDQNVRRSSWKLSSSTSDSRMSGNDITEPLTDD